MDSRSFFAFALIATALGGLVAVATGWLKVANGGITIGDPNAAAPAGAGVAAPNGGSFGSYGAPAPAAGAAPNSGSFGTYGGSAISQILTPRSTSTSLGQIYDSTQPLALAISGDGVAVAPYGVGVQ